jgi:hypothetical protein
MTLSADVVSAGGNQVMSEAKLSEENDKLKKAKRK